MSGDGDVFIVVIFDGSNVKSRNMALWSLVRDFHDKISINIILVAFGEFGVDTAIFSFVPISELFIDRGV